MERAAEILQGAIVHESDRLEGVMTSLVVSAGQGEVLLAREAAWLTRETAHLSSSVAAAVRQSFPMVPRRTDDDSMQTWPQTNQKNETSRPMIQDPPYGYLASTLRLRKPRRGGQGPLCRGHAELGDPAYYPEIDQYCDEIHRACKGFGTDEKALIAILGTKNAVERSLIAFRYPQMHSKKLKDLMKRKTAEIRFRTQLLALPSIE
ncbi:hypothetical protein THAOC_19272, partial [Thalassiosira oceanica]